MKPIKLTPLVKQMLKESLLKDLDKELDALKLSDSTVKFNYDLKDILKVDPNTVRKPIVYMMAPTYLKMLQYVLLSENEIAWRGTVERKEHIFFIKDVFLYPQQVTGTTVQEDPDAGQRWADALPATTYNTMRFQGHSHVNMGAFWSGTDKADQHAHLQELLDDDYYIFAVMNKKQDILMEVYDLTQNVIFEKEDVTFKVFLNKDTTISAIKTEIETFIKKPTTTYFNSYGTYHNNYESYSRCDWDDDDIYYRQSAPKSNKDSNTSKKSPLKVKQHVVINDRVNKDFAKNYPEYEGFNTTIRFNGIDYCVFVPHQPFSNHTILELRKEGWKIRAMPVPETVKI
jgi:hypothetical protein